MAKGPSPTARTKVWLRSMGLVEWTVETRPIPGSFITRDFCNFADVIAFDASHTIAVQATSTDNVTKRIAKILDEPMAWVWAVGGRQVWVVGWKRYAEAVDRKHWRPTIARIVAEEFPAEVVEAGQKLIEAD